MGRILFIWELGAGYGHMVRFLPLALKLRERGHEVIFTLRDLSHAEIIIGRHGFPLLQAPVWLPRITGLPNPPLNYAEILQRFGFLDPSGLTGMTKAYQNLFELVKPALLVIDHAPTALLASQGAGIRRCLIGSGFSSPPRKSPMPNMRPWIDVSEQRLIMSEQKVVSVINNVLSGLGSRPLHILSDLFNVEEDFLCTFPELDHYQDRGKAHYWGPILDLQGGIPLRNESYRPQPKARIEGPTEGNKKIFAYLKPRYRDFEKIVQELHTLPYTTLIHAPGISEDFINKYQSKNLSFSLQPIHIGQAREWCDLAICHAGHGTVPAMLLAGRPLLMLPMHLEQYLLSLNVVNYGAGLLVNPELQNHDYRGLINQLLKVPSFAERAQSFAEKYADFNSSMQVEDIVKRCLRLVE